MALAVGIAMIPPTIVGQEKKDEKKGGRKKGDKSELTRRAVPHD